MKTAARSTARYRWGVLFRVLLAVPGGYGVSALACALLAHALVALGAMDRAPAVLLASLSGFVLYTAVVLWAFHVQRLQRVAAMLLGAGVLLAVALWVVQGGA